MPIIKMDRLRRDLLANHARWSAKSSWLTTISDARRATMLGVAVDREDLANIARIASSTPITAALLPLPTEVDWRDRNGKNHISPVKNQGGCGSCVSFCTVALMESMASIEKGRQFLDLSEADMHFCSSHGESCGGWWPTSALQEAKARGAVDEGSFPYDAGNPSCLLVPNRDKKAVRITSFDTLSTMQQRKRWLADVGPLSAVFHVYDDFFSYSNGVYKHVTGAEAGYHCVEVVGYSDRDQCWICKNSWGPAWGDAGYFRIEYGQCGIDDTSTDTDSNGAVLKFPMWGAQGIKLPAPPAPKIKQVDACINSDGRLEVFAIEKGDSSVRMIWQTRPSAGPWSSWGELGGWVKQVRTVLNRDGRLECFGIGRDDAVWHCWQRRPHAGPWSGWRSLGGRVKAIAPARNSDGRLEVFAIGTDNALWNIWQTRPSAGPWSNWGRLGGWIKEVEPILNSDGRLEVFGVGRDDALWNIWQTRPHAGPWSGWNSLGGKVRGVRAVQNSDGRLEVFAIGTDNAMWGKWQTRPSAGPWSGWHSFGGWVRALAATRNRDGRLEVFAIGRSNGVHLNYQTRPHAGPWSGWRSLGGRAKAIDAIRNRDGRLEVFVIGTNDDLWNAWQTRPSAGPWSGWNKLGG